MPVEANRTAVTHTILILQKMLILPPTLIKEGWGEAPLVTQSINICKTEGLPFTTLQPFMCHCAACPGVQLRNLSTLQEVRRNICPFTPKHSLSSWPCTEESETLACLLNHDSSGNY